MNKLKKYVHIYNKENLNLTKVNLLERLHSHGKSKNFIFIFMHLHFTEANRNIFKNKVSSLPGFSKMVPNHLLPLKFTSVGGQTIYCLTNSPMLIAQLVGLLSHCQTVSAILGWIKPKTFKWLFFQLPCHGPWNLLEIVKGLVGSLSVYCDWVG